MSADTPTVPQPGSHLSQIPTDRHLLHQAEAGSIAARQALVLRYRNAIEKYLRRLLGNVHDAEDVTNVLLVNMLQQGFAAWQPEQERFRDYLKRAVREAARACRKEARRILRVDVDVEQLMARDAGAGQPDPWVTTWRAVILHKAWKALRRYQHEHRREKNIFYTVLRLRRAQPRCHSEQLAASLTAKTGRPFTAANARKQLERARRCFADLLCQEVARTLPAARNGQLAEELAALGLMRYVRRFLPDQQ
jgi:DNA-directed RNA polymerase specialized sigma24 family protein